MPIIQGLAKPIGEPAFLHAIPSPSLPATLEDTIGPALSSLQFYTVFTNNPKLKEGERYGRVFQGSIQTFDQHISLLLNNSSHLRHFHLELVAAEDPSRSLQLIVRSTPILIDWTLLQWELPSEWQNIPVFLQVQHIGRHHALASLTFSDAFESASRNPLSPQWLPLLVTIVKLLLYGSLLLLPAVAIQLHFFTHSHSTRYPHALWFVLKLLLILSACAYSLFFLYLLHPVAGLIMGGTLMGWSLLRLAQADMRVAAVQLYQADRDLRTALQLWILSTLVVLFSGLLFGGADSIAITSQIRYLESRLPDDNLLPSILVERLFLDQPLSPFFHGWLSSDRPPLQSALLLLVRPFLLHPSNDLQLTSILLQTSMVPMAFFTLRGFGVGRRNSYLSTLSLVFSSSFLLNGFFVWPKLLPVTYLLATTLLLFRPEAVLQTHSPRLRAILLGITSACAMLTHGGSIFALLPLFGVALLGLRLPLPRYWPHLILSGLLLMLPWMLYQKLLDPPGDRLLRWHIAGVTGDVAHDSGLLSLMLQQYRALGWETWLQYKLANLRAVLGDPGIAFRHLFPFQANNHFHLLRSGMFLSFVQSHLPQALFGLLLPLCLITRQGRSYAQSLFPLLAVSITGVLIWMLLMFSPGRTILHQGTYHLSFCLMLFAVPVCLLRFPRLGFALLLLQIMALSWIWVLPAIPLGSHPDWVIHTMRFDPVALAGFCITTLIAVVIGLRLQSAEFNP